MQHACRHNQFQETQRETERVFFFDVLPFLMFCPWASSACHLLSIMKCSFPMTNAGLPIAFVHILLWTLQTVNQKECSALLRTLSIYHIHSSWSMSADTFSSRRNVCIHTQTHTHSHQNSHTNVSELSHTIISIHENDVGYKHMCMIFG